MRKSEIFAITVFALIVTIAYTATPASAEPTVSIKMEKTTYTYCEKLFYTIEVSEVTGEIAIIHIRDETGKGSSAIPFAITGLQNPVPSLASFQKEIFPVGKYFIDVQYQGAEDTAEFSLVDSEKICMPEVIKPILSNWITGNISDGFMVDAFQKYVDKRLINIPFEIDEQNVYDIRVPNWVKNVGQWWLQGIISDDDFAQCINYLADKNMINLIAESGI